MDLYLSRLFNFFRGGRDSLPRTLTLDAVLLLSRWHLQGRRVSQLPGCWVGSKAFESKGRGKRDSAWLPWPSQPHPHCVQHRYLHHGSSPAAPSATTGTGPEAGSGQGLPLICTQFSPLAAQFLPPSPSSLLLPVFFPYIMLKLIMNIKHAKDEYLPKIIENVCFRSRKWRLPWGPVTVLDLNILERISSQTALRH